MYLTSFMVNMFLQNLYHFVNLLKEITIIEDIEGQNGNSIYF